MTGILAEMLADHTEFPYFPYIVKLEMQQHKLEVMFQEVPTFQHVQEPEVKHGDQDAGAPAKFESTNPTDQNMKQEIFHGNKRCKQEGQAYIVKYEADDGLPPGPPLPDPQDPATEADVEKWMNGAGL